MNIESVGMAEYRLQVFGRLIKKLRSSLRGRVAPRRLAKKLKENAHICLLEV